MRTEPRHAQRLSGEKERRTRRGEEVEEEEEEVSPPDPDGQPNLPHGISSFRDPIFPM